MVTKFSEYSKKWLESKKIKIKYSTYCAYENIVLNYLDTYFDLFDSSIKKAYNSAYLFFKICSARLFPDSAKQQRSSQQCANVSVFAQGEIIENFSASACPRGR